MMLDPVALADLVAIAQTGSFSAAAQRRRAAISTITRRIDALEHATGLRLVDRSSRGARLTEAGLAIRGLSEPLAEQLNRVERAVESMRGGNRTSPIRISATELIIADILAPALPALVGLAPTVTVQLQSEGAVVSLAGREADLAIRMSRPSGASLYTRRLGEFPLGLFASQAYLADRDPAAINLTEERLLAYDETYGPIPELEWIAERNLAGRVVLRTGSTRALINATAAGAGIALLPLYGAQRSQLVQLALPVTVPSRHAWLIVHRDLRRNPDVRTIGRWIEMAFSAQRNG